MTQQEETLFAIKEAIQAMEVYNTGEDFALVTSLRRLHELEQKLNMAAVVRPEVESAKEGGLLGNGAKATVAARGLSNCMFYLHKTCICKDECWYTANARKSSEGQP